MWPRLWCPGETVYSQLEKKNERSPEQSLDVFETSSPWRTFRENVFLCFPLSKYLKNRKRHRKTLQKKICRSFDLVQFTLGRAYFDSPTVFELQGLNKLQNHPSQNFWETLPRFCSPGETIHSRSGNRALSRPILPRPIPLALYKWAIKYERNKDENHRNASAIKFRFVPF